jgi:L-aspartate oxidase
MNESMRALPRSGTFRPALPRSGTFRPKENCPIIIGAGLAGLMAALHLAPEPVLVLSRSPLGEDAASGWAQGGLAAAIGGDDSPDLHLADTLAAGDGLCDEAVARRIVQAGPALVDELSALGARFDRDPQGRIGLGLEAGHGRRRIVHAAGDASGREILRAVIEAVRRTPSISVWEGVAATRLVLRDGTVAGVLAQEQGQGSPRVLRSSRVVIATGGLGGLYEHSTNPSGAIGQGLIMAAHAGAALADLEFVQFHPTALDAGLDPMPLVSEAVRGEGAILIDETGTRFMAGMGRAELEPRDIVSRAVWRRMEAGHTVFLDARSALGPRFAARFPGITAACLAAGIDPATMPIPIRPAAHYHMGGIAVDGEGRSTVPGLWACGEAASTGLHGANRLASNSLLEAAVTGRWVAESIAGTPASRAAPLAAVGEQADESVAAIRPIMSRHAGVLRTAAGLKTAIAELGPLAAASGAASLALMMTTAMLRREESRGGHFRTDFPRTSEGNPVRATITEAQARRAQGVI